MAYSKVPPKHLRAAIFVVSTKPKRHLVISPKQFSHIENCFAEFCLIFFADVPGNRPALRPSRRNHDQPTPCIASGTAHPVVQELPEPMGCQGTANSLPSLEALCRP
jgi:hypothetical protein